MDAAMEGALRSQLLDRRERLDRSIRKVGKADDLVRLLQDVDAALARIDTRTYGGCEVCKETVDDEFLAENPLITWCLCQLSPEQQSLLQDDLELASRIQWALLPKQDSLHAGFETHFRYLPAGPVSGDYCDLVTRDGEHQALYFLVGDVSGKGVAASFHMARLNALFRTLIDTGLPITQLVERANRHFGDERKDASHYATLACGRAEASGEIEICNAGHCPPLVLRASGVETVASTGFPVGMFGSGPYTSQRIGLAPGDTLVLYTDGLTEARNEAGEEFGASRLADVAHQGSRLPLRSLAAACLRELAVFQNGTARADDLTLLLLRRAA